MAVANIRGRLIRLERQVGLGVPWDGVDLLDCYCRWPFLCPECDLESAPPGFQRYVHAWLINWAVHGALDPEEDRLVQEVRRIKARRPLTPRETVEYRERIIAARQDRAEDRELLGVDESAEPDDVVAAAMAMARAEDFTPAELAELRGMIRDTLEYLRKVRETIDAAEA